MEITAQPLKAIIDTFAEHGQPAAVDRAKALFAAVLEERYRAAVKAVDMAYLAYRAATTLEEMDAAYAETTRADRELDDTQRMLQASRTKLPYPNFKGD